MKASSLCPRYPGRPPCAFLTALLVAHLWHAAAAAGAPPACCAGSGCCAPPGEPCTLSYGASGTIRDAVTNEPIAGARVTVLEASTVTNADGAFEVSGSRADTCNIDYFYSISVSAPGYQGHHSSLYTTGVFSRGDIELLPLVPPTPEPGEPTSTPTPSHCPSRTPCPFGDRPRPCDSEPCGLGCGCEACPECPEGEILEPHANACDCVPEFTPTPFADLPDLVASGAFLIDSTPPPECIDDPGEYITRSVPIGICVDNRGGLEAGPFAVTVDGNVLRFDGVPARDVVCKGSVSHAIDVPETLVHVDTADEVAEGDEGNNRERLTVPLPPMPPLCSTQPRVDIGSIAGEPGESVTFDVVLRTRGDSIAFVDHGITFDPETPIGARDNGSPDCEPNAAIVSGEFEFLPAGCEGPECSEVHARIESLAGPLPDSAVLYRCTATITTEPAEICHHTLGCVELTAGADAEDAAAAPCADGLIASAFPREPATFSFAISPERPRVGDAVELTVDVDVDGGRAVYDLRGAEPFFAGDTDSVSQGSLGPVTYQLFAVEAGVASLVMSVSYESEFGCPGVSIHHRTGESSEPFVVEILEAEPTATPTPPHDCPTPTLPICPTDTIVRCQFPPAVPCLECRCDSCPPCAAGFTRVGTCDCAPVPTAAPPLDSSGVAGGGGGGGGCAIDADRPAGGAIWWLLALAPLLAARARGVRTFRG